MEKGIILKETPEAASLTDQQKENGSDIFLTQQYLGWKFFLNPKKLGQK